jgi:formate dehydrogenase
VLPATTFLEREDLPVASLSLFTTPFVQFTDAVVEPYGEARQEWRIIEAIARHAGFVPFLPRWAGRPLTRVPGVAPATLLNLLLRFGPYGDRFGLRRGLSLARLRRHPHGLVLGEHVRTGVLRDVVQHRDHRVRLHPPEIRAEIERLELHHDDTGYPLHLIGLRELRSQNSWMHNSAALMRGDRTHAARVHPADAAEYGVRDGGMCRITSRHGSIALPAKLTDEVMRGTVAVPHGWGHRDGRWRRANQAGGANVNLLASSDPADLERLAGMAHLNGIPVRLEPA